MGKKYHTNLEHSQFLLKFPTVKIPTKMFYNMDLTHSPYSAVNFFSFQSMFMGKLRRNYKINLRPDAPS